MRQTNLGRLRNLAAWLTFGVLVGVGLGLLSQARKPSPERPKLQKVAQQQQGPAVTLEGGIDWINVAGPIQIEDLKGKIILLDFWTYCCINCHHVIPDLEYLEEKYPNELVVIGVHTAKFDAEKDTENIRKKVTEYRIKHPVINDANQVVWNRFGARAWPTLVLIDANGRYVGQVSGEGHRETLDKVIAKLIKEHEARGELDRTPLHFPAEIYKPHEGPLLFPGKILADEESKRLFITDTGHNRIVITDLDGQHLETIGDGASGLKDGSFDQAEFDRPQGLCLIDNVLYVADVENHAIRACDLEAKTVKTVAGTGEQSYRRSGGGPATKTGLNSPWDVAQMQDSQSLLIAMAGPHQIWKLDLDEERVSVWAGTGREDIQDGPIEQATFAQSSGLDSDGQALFIADSEGSAVRAVTLEKPHKVVTIAGPHDLPFGQGLFAFGDRDGRGDQVRFQHCLDVAYGDGKLYVADSYNNKIKVIDLANREVKTLAGTRQAGQLDDPPQFHEPGGLSVLGKSLYIADTNNHAIRVMNLDDQKVKTLTLTGVAAPTPPPSKPRFPDPIIVDVPAVQVAPGSAFKLDVAIDLPEGFTVNPEAPMPILLETPEAPDALGSEVSPTGFRLDPPRAQFEVDVPLAQPSEAGQSLEVRLSVSSFECKEGAAGFCLVKNYVWRVPVSFAEGGESVVSLATPKAEDESAE